MSQTKARKKPGVVRFFEGIAEFFTSTVKAFVEGDIFVKLSALLCGTSCFARKQYLKGFFICLIQAAIMLVFPTFFFPYMSKLSTLGTVQQKRVFNPETMKNEFNDYDNSFLILLFGVLGVVLLITAVIYTMIATPFAATMIVRTRSQQERGNMGILRAVGSYASGMVIAIATIPVTNMLGGTQAAWIKYGAVIALIVLLSLLICYANGSKAMRKVVEDDTAAAEPEEEPVEFLTAVKCLFGNKYWVIVLLFNLITAVSSAIAASSGAYYCKWIFGNDNLVAIAGSAGLLSTFLGFALSNPIIKKLGVKGTINLGLLGYAASCAVRCFVPTNLAAYIGSGLVGSFLQIPLMCLYGVLLAMAVDYNEYKYDKKLVAVSSGAIGFGNKVGGGLGALVLALFLMIGSYDSTLSAATTSMRYAIYAFSNYLPIVLNVGMFLIFRGFDLEEKLPAMRAEVAKRHTQKSEE